MIREANEEMSVSGEKIYVFDRPPSDLKPVAGIATVSEGNLVSHVQLLARNLGIPNAVISPRNFESILAWHGKTVFYAVSPKGTLVLKPEEEMTAEEKALFEVKSRSENRVAVEVDRIELDKKAVLDLRDVKADASGRLCGPKAANLGQLKAMFPEKVVEGLVIPFGVFRQHLDQPMPGNGTSYWDCLEGIFDDIPYLRSRGVSAADIETHLLNELAYFRGEIKRIAFLPGFEQDLRRQFKEVLGSELGTLGVFLRSDTNMEDLKEFTGAGLNLTLFNVVDAAKILQGIRDVWASPYSERSYKWRQHYLTNPEHVYPSILVIPSVNVDKSGVLITTGIASGNPDQNTVAFSRGVGGAVEGQIAETWLLEQGKEDRLLSPARETQYTSLPESGGTEKVQTGFSSPVLDKANREAILRLSDEVRNRLPNSPGVDSKGPYDTELGFLQGEMWLFQVRPFVENRQATKSSYLQSITPEIKASSKVQLSRPLSI